MSRYHSEHDIDLSIRRSKQAETVALLSGILAAATLILSIIALNRPHVDPVTPGPDLTTFKIVDEVSNNLTKTIEIVDQETGDILVIAKETGENSADIAALKVEVDLVEKQVSAETPGSSGVEQSRPLTKAHDGPHEGAVTAHCATGGEPVPAQIHLREQKSRPHKASGPVYPLIPGYPWPDKNRSIYTLQKEERGIEQ